MKTAAVNKQDLMQHAQQDMQKWISDSDLTDRQKLALTCRILFDHGHDAGLAGQITCRSENKETFITQRFGLGFDEITASNLLEVNQDLEPINQEGMANPANRFHTWIYKEHPEVIFLAEAFTKPAMMHALGKAGFQQSYTYFTWRTSKEDLTNYGNEVAHWTSAFFRPNFWVNTPDILPYHLQSGNPAMFALRAVLASTLTPSWGMYAGYELYESKPLAQGKEEYWESEKYQIKNRDWEGAAKKGLTLAPFIAQLNKIRKENIALQRLRNLHFHHTDSGAIIAYSKREGDNLILVVVNLDPTYAQETTVHWNMQALGINQEQFKVTDLLDESVHQWSAHTFVRLQPSRPVGKVAHIVKVEI